MLNFSKNTYIVNYDDRHEVINILKNYPEYKGFTNNGDWHDRIFKDQYPPLWSELEQRFAHFDRCDLYLDNEYVTDKLILDNPKVVKIAEVYKNGVCVQHTPKNLLSELQQLAKQLIKIE